MQYFQLGGVDIILIPGDLVYRGEYQSHVGFRDGLYRLKNYEAVLQINGKIFNKGVIVMSEKTMSSPLCRAKSMLKQVNL